jgi:hypothetical protein
MAGTLIAHRGGVVRTREELQGLATPAATESWKPVPHWDLVNSLIDGLTEHAVQVTRESYATSGKDDARLFGVLDLVIPGLAIPDYGLSLGIRGSNDKSLAIQATAGARVFVCDNMAFSGDSGTVVLKKKHTSRLDLRAVVPPAIDTYLDKANAFVVDIDRMKDFALTDAIAKQTVYDLFLRTKVLPLRLLPVVHDLYFNDEEQRADFPDRSLWSLNNAFTEGVKDIKSEASRMQRQLGIGRAFARVLYRDGRPAPAKVIDLGVANVVEDEPAAQEGQAEPAADWDVLGDFGVN